MDRPSNAVGTDRLTAERSEREDALSRADDLAKRAASTRAIGRLTLAERASVHAELQAAIDAATHRGTLTDPIPDAQFETAAVLLAWLRRSAGRYLDVCPPLVTLSGEFVFELWRGPRKLTLYVEADGSVSVLRVWGDHAGDMDEPPYDKRARDGLLRWLETGEEMPG